MMLIQLQNLKLLLNNYKVFRKEGNLNLLLYMNKFIEELLVTMNLKQLKEIFLSLNEKDNNCSYIQKIRDDVILFCKQLKSY